MLCKNTLDAMMNLRVTEDQLDAAFKTVCKQRQHFPPDADIWPFWRDWPKLKARLLDTINRGEYRFSPLHGTCQKNLQFAYIWPSMDAVVIKVVTSLLQQQLDLSPTCTHLKGHGGLKQTVCDVQTKLEDYRFVCKTDVKGFYESIDQYTLLNLIADQVPDTLLRHYCYQIVRRTVEYGGEYRDVEQGISRGCALSPLLGALYLRELDERMSDRPGIYYVRYMDDILIMTQTRWQNRRAIKIVNQTFNRLKLKQHPDKTFIGRIDKGFDFLGYRFSRQPLQLASITVKKHVEKLYRLYEQQTEHKKASSEELALVLGQYVQRWLRWCTAGLSGIKLEFYDDACNPLPLRLGP